MECTDAGGQCEATKDLKWGNGMEEERRKEESEKEKTGKRERRRALNGILLCVHAMLCWLAACLLCFVAGLACSLAGDHASEPLFLSLFFSPLSLSLFLALVTDTPVGPNLHLISF